MARSESTLANKPKTQRIAPVWRGVGCVMLLALTFGAYALGGLVLSVNAKTPFIPLPALADIGFTLGPVDVPVGIALANSGQPPQGRVVAVGPVDLTVGSVKFYVSWLQLAVTAVVDIFAYALMVIVWGMAHPYKPGPTDAPPVRPRKGRQKSLIR
jgi:hypothetical protein